MTNTAIATIPRIYNDVLITQRVDGYWNATAMCKACGKLWADYRRLGSTQEYLDELSSIMGIPINDLVESRQGQPEHGGGTWVHRKVAIHLAQWLSPKFAVRVTDWVEELLTKGVVSLGQQQPQPSQPLPWSKRVSAYLIRFKSRVAMAHPGHWSVGPEVMGDLLKIEDVLLAHGFPIRLSDLPDGSVGRRWARFRRGKPWAMSVHNDVPLETPYRQDGHDLLVYPAVYRPEEAEHFDLWFRPEYIQKHLPEYLVDKVQRDCEKWLSLGTKAPDEVSVLRAADDASRELTGAPARLSKKQAAVLLLADKQSNETGSSVTKKALYAHTAYSAHPADREQRGSLQPTVASR